MSLEEPSFKCAKCWEFVKLRWVCKEDNSFPNNDEERLLNKGYNHTLRQIYTLEWCCNEHGIDVDNHHKKNEGN